MVIRIAVRLDFHIAAGALSNLYLWGPSRFFLGIENGHR